MSLPTARTVAPWHVHVRAWWRDLARAMANEAARAMEQAAEELVMRMERIDGLTGHWDHQKKEGE